MDNFQKNNYIITITLEIFSIDWQGKERGQNVWHFRSIKVLS